VIQRKPWGLLDGGTLLEDCLGRREEGARNSKRKGKATKKKGNFIGWRRSWLFNYIGSGKTAIHRGQNFQKNKFDPKEALN